MAYVKLIPIPEVKSLIDFHQEKSFSVCTMSMYTFVNRFKYFQKGISVLRYTQIKKIGITIEYPATKATCTSRK